MTLRQPGLAVRLLEVVREWLAVGKQTTVDETRNLNRSGRRIEVMILVKTTPTPSSKYEDTVCVAGWALDPNPPRWVRLYPIPFRHLDADQQFPKYATVSVEVSKPSNDPRAESLRVRLDTISVTHKRPSGGRERHEAMAQVPVTTACRLRAGVEEDINGPSLGLVIPQRPCLEIKPHEGWNQKQADTIRRWQQQDTLPIPKLARRPAPPLEAPPLRAWYRYRCGEPSCPGHRQGILDWELTALQRNAQRQGADVEEWVRHKFSEQMLAPDRRPMFILGNQAEAAKRKNFSVLSVYWPTAAEACQGQADTATLF